MLLNNIAKCYKYFAFLFFLSLGITIYYHSFSKRFTFEKMGWNQEKVDEILLPVLKRMNAKESHR